MLIVNLYILYKKVSTYILYKKVSTLNFYTTFTYRQ